MATTDSDSGRPHSYVARHWRGELSLPQSYWINGALIFGIASNIALLAASGATIVLFQQQPDLGVPILLLLLLLQIAVYVWALVGTWRSAGHYRGPRVWAILARVGLCLGILISLANISRTLQGVDTQFHSSDQLAGP